MIQSIYVTKINLFKTKMENDMKQLNPYLRQIFVSNTLVNDDFVKAYDCRFFFVLSGSGELLTEKECFRLSENTLAYYPSGFPYFLKSSANDPLSFVTVNFDFTRSYPTRTETLKPVKLCDFSAELERPTQNEIGEKRFCSAFTLDHAFSLRDDFLSLSAMFREKGEYIEELCSTLLKYIILKIANHFHETSKNSEIVSRVSQYIEANCAESLDNYTIAAHFGYHPYYLSSVFKAHTRRTLHQYALEARLKLGANLLLSTDMPISQIAVECGFKDANHFSVKFKKQYGKPPSNWRQINSMI